MPQQTSASIRLKMSDEDKVVPAGDDFFKILRLTTADAVLVLLPLGLGIGVIEQYVAALWRAMTKLLSTASTGDIIPSVRGIVFVLSMGWVMYVLKMKRLLRYAVIELIVGLMFAVDAVLTFEQKGYDGSTAAKMAGAVYLVVRALENAGKEWAPLLETARGTWPEPYRGKSRKPRPSDRGPSDFIP
jgi:hypothetical protein